MPENTNKDKLSNYSLDLDGTSEYIEFPDTNFLNNGQASFSFWIKPKTWPGGSDYGYFLSGSTVGGLAYSEGSSAGSYYPGVLYWYNGSTSYIFNVTLSENVWSHIVIVFDGTSVKTYKDGALGTTTTIVQPSALSFNTIGRYKPTTTHYVNGFLSEFSIFDYAVSPSQVSYLYNLNNPMAITGKKPTAYWSLGDNSNPSALAGYPNLSIVGSVFDFIPNDYIDLGTTPFSFTQNLTVSFWIKSTQTALNTFIGKDVNGTSTRNWMVMLYQNKVYFWTTSTGSTSNLKDIQSNVAGVVSDGKWHHIVCVNNQTNLTKQIYIDGVLDVTNNKGGLISTSSSPVQIGKRPSGSPYDGEMSNVALWDTALTGPQVETIYNNGAPNDISSLSPVAWYKLNSADTFDGSNWTITDYGSGGNDGTSVGMTSANLVQSNLDSTTPYSNYSVSFNGGTEFMRTPTNYGSYLSGATSCSVSVWVKVDNTSLMQPVVSCWSTPDNTKSYLIRYVSDSRKFQFYLWGPVGAGDSRFGLANAEKAISANTWYHIVGTWDGTTIKIYQDGVFEGSENAPGGALQTVNQQNWTGRYSSTFLGGDVSNQAFWKNTVLTQSEITEIYNAGVPTDLNNFSGTAPTVWYPMDEKATYFPGANNPTEPYIRDIISDRYASGLNMDTSNFVGNAPGSFANGTGNNLDISNLKGEMSNSINNSYSINMADYGDPNNQGLTPANSGRTTEVPG